MLSDALIVHPGRPLTGRLVMPGDKSISHRALIFSGLARGGARITGLLEAGDVRSTAACMQALGAQIERRGGAAVVRGRAGALAEPRDVLDCGNSGTTIRLLCGLLAPQPLYAVLTGDASLRRRPMRRVTGPLAEMGARFDGRAGGALAPLTVRGGPLEAGEYRSPVASGQVKTAMILAALGASGTLRYREPGLSRDHSERMLAHMGVDLERREGALVVPGGQVPEGRDVAVPGDISSAAFLLVAAAITPGSELVLEGVGINPTRTGVIDALAAMGASVEILDRREVGGEPAADLRVCGGPLVGARIDGGLIPRVIDELPVLAVAAALAEGETVIADAAELRVKESDRVEATVAGLRAIGAEAEARPDGLVIRGSGGAALAGGAVDAQGDHRIAMAFAVAGLRCGAGCRVSGARSIATSFPGFPALLASAGGEVNTAAPGERP